MLKEFYETFCNEVKHICQKSLKQVKEKGQLSISERQAIIKLIEKKIDTKIISKSLTTTPKKVLPKIISSNEATYVNFIRDGLFRDFSPMVGIFAPLP